MPIGLFKKITQNNLTKILIFILLINFLVSNIVFAAMNENEKTIYINEFMASNGDTIHDEYGDFGDWIEIYNPTDKPVDIGGYYISDQIDEPLKYQITDNQPEKTTIPPNDYILLWADTDTGKGPLHLDIKLSKDGESIILTSPDKETIIDQIEFEKQERDVSYGRKTDNINSWDFFLEPTPLAPNNSGGFSSLKILGIYSFYTNNSLLIYGIIILFLIIIFLSLIIFKYNNKFKKNKDSLKILNEEQTLLLDNIQTQIWYLKDVVNYGKANKARLEFLEVNSKTLEDESIFEIHNEDEANQCLEENVKIYQNKKQIKIKKWVVNGRGKKRFLLIIKTPKIGKNGQVEFLVCSAEDITEKTRIEKQIISLTKEYETIFSNTQDAIFLVNVGKDGKFRYSKINFSYIANTGFSHEELKDKTPKEVYGKKFGQEIELNYKKCLKDRKIISYDEELEMPVGSKIYHTILTPVIADDKVVQIVGSSRDITTRRKMESKIKQSEREYKSLFKDSPIGLIKIDCEGNIIDINNELIQLIGLPEKENIQVNLFNLPILENNQLKQDIKKSIDKIKPILGELKFILKGKISWINYNIKPIINDDKKIEELIIASQDITEKKDAEERIKDLTFHDSLTGLYNRTYFNEELKRYNTKRQLPLSIIIGDVNGLKLTNDAFGHQEGDKLLVKAANIIKGSCRQEDLVARWGGDEFVVLLPNTDASSVKEILKRIKTACHQSELSPIRPSIALGSSTKHKSSEDIQMVYKKAENRMYKNKLIESKKVYNNIVSSLKSTLGQNNFETEEHIKDIKVLAVKIGKAMKLTETELTNLALLAELHDLGNVAIPKTILQKRGKLTFEEWEEIKRHPEIGYNIVSTSSELSNVAEGILGHHERWDGQGYPRGVKGEEIPLISRIIFIVDAFDIMTRGRHYQDAISEEKAIKELKDNAGRQFDPEIVDIFINKII